MEGIGDATGDDRHDEAAPISSATTGSATAVAAMVLGTVSVGMIATVRTIPAKPRLSAMKSDAINGSGSPMGASQAIAAMHRLDSSSVGFRPTRSERKGTARLAAKAASPEAPRSAPIAGSERL